ncbi:MAG TPA: hypothetical protein VMT96_00280 [Candidatus Bathyarchaeia archaeon]|nr:hypothetical protein [Candidatus Bathyarchaeia archaeon]
MQPNQQNLNQPNVPPAPNAGGAPTEQQPNRVPDYLHFDPVTVQAPKSRMRMKWVVIILAGISLLSIIAAIVWFWQSKVTEGAFYTALNNLMQKGYVVRTMTISGENPAISATVKTTSDFTVTTDPKSQIEYTYSNPLGFDNSSQPSEVAGEVITLNHNGFLATLTKAFPALLGTDLQTGKWYSVSHTDTNLANRLDVLGAHASLNSLFCSVPFGKFDDDKRGRYMELLKDDNIYRIQGSTSGSLNGRPHTIVDVTIDQQGLKQLAADAQGVLGIALSSSCAGSDQSKTTYGFWINKGDNQLDKIVVESRNVKDKSVVKTDTIFQYPDSVVFDSPSNPAKAPSIN